MRERRETKLMLIAWTIGALLVVAMSMLSIPDQSHAIARSPSSSTAATAQTQTPLTAAVANLPVLSAAAQPTTTSLVLVVTKAHAALMADDSIGNPAYPEAIQYVAAHAGLSYDQVARLTLPTMTLGQLLTLAHDYNSSQPIYPVLVITRAHIALTANDSIGNPPYPEAIQYVAARSGLSYSQVESLIQPNMTLGQLLSSA